MFQLDVKSRKSIYEQVVDNLKELIVSGVLKEDEKLPSVRDLSGQLTVNPNTVQKAYRELERQGYVYTTSGLGTFVAGRAEQQIDTAMLQKVLAELRAGIRELQYLGLSRDEAMDRIRKLFEERSDWK
jgi:GntR family transcriptional regulator